MNNRPKIASLTEKELAQLLIDSFFKIGREINPPPDKLKIFLAEVYKYQGWMFADTFSDAFSRYAACELPDAEKLHLQVSPMFVSRLMKLYFKTCDEKKSITKPPKDSASALSPEEKFTLFIKHITANRCLPANPDWVTIYEHLSKLNKITISDKWPALSFPQKLKIAMLAVHEWAYNHFTITNNLLYKNNLSSSPLKGIGTRLGETLQ